MPFEGAVTTATVTDLSTTVVFAAGTTIHLYGAVLYSGTTIAILAKIYRDAAGTKPVTVLQTTTDIPNNVKASDWTKPVIANGLAVYRSNTAGDSLLIIRYAGNK